MVLEMGNVNLHATSMQVLLQDVKEKQETLTAKLRKLD
jgi:hypothetical protein